MTADDLWEAGAAKGVKAGGRVPWGQMSLTNGAASILSAVIAAIVNVIFWRSPPPGLPSAAASVGTVLGLVVALGVTGFGIAAGLKARQAAPDDSRHALLAAAGVVIGIAAMLLWIAVGIDLLASVSSFTG
jgi:hypothetical protein